MTNNNMLAFLSMIAWAELGDDIINGSQNGYNVLIGSTPGNIVTFPSYNDHPRVMVDLGNGLVSSAAGRYQILGWIFDAYKGILGLKDFSPLSQDLIAKKLISERHADLLIERGDIIGAIKLVRKVWASFPGAGYEGQHSHKMADMVSRYKGYGGEAR